MYWPGGDVVKLMLAELSGGKKKKKTTTPRRSDWLAHSVAYAGKRAAITSEGSFIVCVFLSKLIISYVKSQNCHIKQGVTK